MAIKVVGEVRLPPEHAMHVMRGGDRAKGGNERDVRVSQLLLPAQVVQLAQSVPTWHYSKQYSPLESVEQYKGELIVGVSLAVTIRVAKNYNGRMNQYSYTIEAFTDNGHISLASERNHEPQVKELWDVLQERRSNAERHISQEPLTRGLQQERDIVLVNAFLAEQRVEKSALPVNKIGFRS